ncbi:aldehyde reductase [Streptomyces sp. TS71-3]|uniref:SDR family oxidoreductase n=1 Tax=Streptomyces sp. TS71-3 TaxID=2733862 RepID=UPI001B22FBDE|nr:aldehyde reductase [Streptomyces sp. TS71-3]GHJ36705.1 dihydroflavonol-4-reductase [Streptomyces sp. TS71-3]
MRVLITGATGYVAGHCIAELLASGYSVRGTVRDLRTADVAHLRALARGTGGELEFVEADLADDSGWIEAVDGCAYVWHVASPFPSTVPRDEDELIRPAIDGTLRVLRAAESSDSVRRVVLTSSGAAVHYGHDSDRVFTEADWTDPGKASPYAKSKTLAEKAAWGFARASGLELVVLNPGTVLGPMLNTDVNTSLELIRRIMRGALPVVPKIGWDVVDVRDLARLHRLAMETPSAAGNRYIAVGRFMWAQEMASVLAGRYRSHGYRIGTGAMPYWLMWVISRFDPSGRLALTFWGREDRSSAAKAEKELGWTSRPPSDAVLDTAASMIELGVVPRR